MELHKQRLLYLDDHHDDHRVFSILLKHHANGKTTPFKLIANKRFDIEVTSDNPEDLNAALYNLLAIMMWPFALPGQSKDAVGLFLAAMAPIHYKSKPAFMRFMTSILDTGFLTTLQHDCLSVRPETS